MKAWIKGLWNREKRRAAILLAVCCIVAGVAELPFPGVQAAGAGAEGTESVAEAGTETLLPEIAEMEIAGTEEEMGRTEAAESTDSESTEEIMEPTEEVAEPTEEIDPEPTEKATEAEDKEEPWFLSLGGTKGAGTDRTEDTAELKITLEELHVLNKDGANLTHKTSTDGGNTIYDVTEHAYYDIGSAKFRVKFEIVKKFDAGRTLQEGDYFIYKFPAGFTLDPSIKTGEIEFKGVKIAEYNKETDSTGAEIIKVTFQKAVTAADKYNDIAGGIDLKINFDSSALEGGGDKLINLLPPRTGSSGAQVKLPEEPSVVNGITKSGIHDSSNNTIDWIVKVGTETESKGMSLNGLILEDVVGDGQTYVPSSAKLVNADGTPALGTLLVTEEAGTGKVTLALEGAEIKAPCFIKLKTAITEEKLKEAKVSVTQPATIRFSNQITMLPPPDASLTIGVKNMSSAEVAAQFGTQVTKNGVQIDSNTIHWTIEVNNADPRIHVYHGVVTDKLTAGLTYKDGSMTYKREDGAAQKPGVTGSTVPWPDNSLEVTGNAATGQTLNFYLAADTRDKYTIEFDTTVAAGYADTTVTNGATIRAELPYWTGAGPGYIDWDYGIPGINCVFDSSMIEKEVSIEKTNSDEPSGILTWTIYPSTRTSVYDDAVITDEIEAKQEYVPGSLVVEKKDGSSIGAGITAGINPSNAKELIITIPSGAGKLGDYKITYKTKALDFFAENSVKETYNNTAVLNIMNGGVSIAEKTAGADTEVLNRFLAKSTAFEYINGIGYFHYTIEVNGNGLTLKNVLVTDDLNDCVFTATGKDTNGAETSITIPSNKWEFDDTLFRTVDKNGVVDATRKPTLSGTTVTANLGSIDQKYTIHLYAKLQDTEKTLLTDLGADGLANKKIYSGNKVKAKSDEVVSSGGATFEVISNSKDKNVCMDNTLVTKNSPKSDMAQGLITWNIVINPHGGPLNDAVIYDELPKSAKYVAGTVKLYNAVRDASGKLIKGTQAADPIVEFSIDKTSRYMKVTLDSNTSGAYILEYDTEVVDTSKPSIINKVSVANGADTYGSTQGEMKLTGGNWGTLSTAGKLEITKFDASVGAAMPLAGAEFTVYSDEECKNPVDMGDSDAAGKMVIYGLEAGTGDTGKNFYVKETKVSSSAYVDNTTVYKVLIKRGETTKIIVENKRKTAIAGSNVEIIKQYKYMDAASAEQTITSKQSEFKLYFYPYGTGNTTGKKQVMFTENSAGDYTYSTSGTAGTVKNNTANGKLVFHDLPWGYYGLEETAVPEGFAAYSGEKYFEISYVEGTGDLLVAYAFNLADDTDNTITNESTSFYVKKLLKGTTTYLTNVTLQICRKEADGSLTVVKNPMTNQDYEWTTVASEASDGHLVKNLPQGKYMLHEVAASTDKTFSIAADIPFEIKGVQGTLTSASAKNGILVMEDTKITLSVRNEDQFHEAVNGAEITVTGPDAVSATGYSKTVTTVNGEAVFENLIRGGVYTVSETKVPDGYKKALDVTIRVSEDGNKIYTKNADGTETEITDMLVMLNRKLLVQIKLSKLDAFSGEELKGAEFSLFRSADMPGSSDTKLLDGILMTDHGTGSDAWVGWNIADTKASVNNAFTGKPLKEGLNAGIYYLEENTVPDGYKEAPKTEFEVTADGELSLISTNHAQISESNQEKLEIQDEPLTLRIEKYDAETNAALTGAEYEITGIFAGEAIEKTLPLGTDAVEQNNALSGKLVSGNVYAINEKKAPLGYRSIEKAYFKLDVSGNVTVTDALGTENLRDDVTALNPADEKAGTDGALQIFDKKIHVAFIKCSSADGKPIDGAVFTVIGDFADKTTEKVLHPAKNAPAELERQLIEGNTYTLQEKAPVGYLPLTGNVSFTYTAAQGLVLTTGSDSHARAVAASSGPADYAYDTIEITNDSAQNTSLQFIQYDKEDNSGILGAKFELSFIPEGGTASQTISYILPEAGTVYKYVTAGEEHQKVTVAGEAFFTDLKRGTYTLTETVSAYAYELGDQPFSCTFTVDDRAINKTIVINKTNAEKNAYDLMVTTGEELLTEKGIVNERMSGSVTLVKVDALDQTQHLNNVGFAIYRYKDSETIVDWFKQLFTGKAYEVKSEIWSEGAEADGTLTIKGLPWGRYYIVETNPLEDYVLDKTKYEFTIGKNRVTQVLDWTPGKDITNAKIQMSFAQITTDGTATFGNQFRMYGRFARYAGPYLEWTVSEEPYVIAGELLENEVYVLRETSPFDGHTSAVEVSFRYSKLGIQLLSGSEDAEIVVDENGNFKLVQKVPPTRVSIEKVDEAGKLLSGASMKLELIAADGTSQTIKEWKSIAEAMKLEGILLVNGNYVLKEIKAPAGYELASDITFTVSNTTEWQTITMIDKVKLPTETESSENTETDSTENENTKPKGDSISGRGNNGGVQEVQITDENNAARKILPKTGREVRSVYYLIGAILVLAGAIICLTEKKKRKNSEKNTK